MWTRSLAFLLVLAAAALVAVGCGDDDSKSEDTKDTKTDSSMSASDNSDDADAGEREPVDVGGMPMYPDKNVIENASTAPNLKTAVAAIKAAGLVETLSGPGPFTVFAPDDAAFAKVDKAALAGLLKPESKQALTAILTYHVVPGTLSASDLKDGDELTTVNGAKLTVSIDGDTVKVGDSTITQADVFQSNGVAHIIDTVLTPPAA
ncbi:MAG: hypothetical protein JWM25_844 [Thermoleophilia bacterium]|nr:hypothetical protein [Thermoleophilia bacterium]MCZ4496261.1 hypothetical protein [Thermoleophilia bacterium]